MPKSRSDYIREELYEDLNIKAQDLIEKLAKKGVRVTAQHIYQLRSDMRKEPTFKQKKGSLATYIIAVLEQQQDSLSDSQIHDLVRKEGYRSASPAFFDLLRKKLYELTEKRMIVKNGLYYKLNENPAPTLRNPIAKSDAMQVIINQGLAADEALRNYHILRDAIVDFAAATGVDDPKGFPDRLIQSRKQYLQVTEDVVAEIRKWQQENG